MKIKIIVLSIASVVIASYLISFLSIQNWFYNDASFKGTDFEENTTLDSSIFTSERLDWLTTYLEDEAETSGMVILENGEVIYKYGDIKEVSYIASCRKSVLAILYGKYVTTGIIDLNQTIGELGIDEVDGLLPIEKEATVKDIIAARSGVFHIPANGGYDEKNAKTRGSVMPGEYFLYNNWDFNVAGYILEQKSGNTVYAELEQQLAIPLGFQDWNIKNQKRKVDKEKSEYSAYHMHLSTRDMAKIGQIMLQGGKWEGKQIINNEWLKKITTTITPVDTVNKRDNTDKSSPVQFSYGNMWWLFERFYDNPDFDGAYTASGYAGQYITVIPKRNIVIAHKTNMDILTAAGLSGRSATPSWKYWWILRNIMLSRKNIADLSTNKSTDEIVNFINDNYNQNSDYDISERLINEYGQQLADKGRYEDAIKFFKLNMELYPVGYYTHRTLDYYGNCLLKLDRNAEAIQIFERSLEFNSTNTKTIDILRELKTPQNKVEN